MAATVQLNIQTNEREVLASIQNIQNALNNLTNRQHTIQINVPQLTQVSGQLNDILNAINNIHSRQNVQIHVTAQGATQAVQSLNAINTTLLDIHQNELRGGDGANIFGNALRRLANIASNELRQAFTSALKEMKAVDTELVTIQKVTGDTASGMKKYADDAYQVAAKLGTSASEYLKAVAEFAKAGYKDRAKELGQLAVVTKAVGDTTQQTANQFLLSVDKAYQFNGSIEKLTEVLDGANEIGNRFPTSVQKIAEGLGKVAPIAAQAHVGIDELSAAIGTITSVTQRSGTETATALRALFLNIIGDTKTEIEDGAKWTAGEIEGLRDVLNMYASDVVKAADATKTLINPMEAVGALAKAMETGSLSEVKLMEMISDIGGKLRTSQLLALIQNYKMYQDQLDAYRESAGSAAKEFSIYLDSWATKTNQLSAAWTNFVQKQLSTRTIKDLVTYITNLVNNLGNLVPLIKALGIAIAALNINRIVTQLGNIIERLRLLVTTGLGPLGAAISVIALAIGYFNTKLNEFAAATRETAKKSKEAADDAKANADSFMELATQLAAAKEGSSKYIEISAQMQQALEDEGIKVNNLAEDYENLTRKKLETAQTLARKSASDANLALLSTYGAEEKKFVRFGDNPITIEGFNLSRGIDQRIYSRFANSAAVRMSVPDQGPMFYAADTTSKGIIATYQLVKGALDEMDQEIYDMIERGEEMAAMKIRNGNLYKDLTRFVDLIGESAEASISASEEYANATTALEGLGVYKDAIDWLKGDGVTKEQYASFLETLKKANDLTESQKNNLRTLGQELYPQWTAELNAMNGGTTKFVSLMQELEESEFSTREELEKWIEALYTNNELTEDQQKALEFLAKQQYPELARAIIMARSALAQYNEAVKDGEKDDSFKSYKSVYDSVIKAAKKGAYGSDAFQYGIRALFDPKTIEEYKGNWSGLVSHMEKSLGGLYKDSESMGQGLLDKIFETGKKTSKGLREVYDEETGKLLASYNKKTGEWMISDEPEDIVNLAGQLGMSAESLVAAGIALGAMDPTADVTGLSEALEEILGGGGEKLTAEQEAALKNEAAANKNESSSNTFADAVTVFASVAEGLVTHFGGESPTGGKTAQEAAQDAREAAIKAALGANAAFPEVTKTYTEAELRAMGIPAAHPGGGTYVKPTASWNAIDAQVSGGLGSVEAKPGWMLDAMFGKGTVAAMTGGKGFALAGLTFSNIVDKIFSGSGARSSDEPVPVTISNKDSAAYHNGVRTPYAGGTVTDAWGDIDFVMSSHGYGFGENTKKKSFLQTMMDSLFGKRASSSASNEPVPVEVVSNKDSNAYHNGDRGGIVTANWGDIDTILSEMGYGTIGSVSTGERGIFGTLIDAIFGKSASRSGASNAGASLGEGLLITPDVTGGEREINRPGGTPNHHRVASEETFRGTGQWVDFPIPEITGAVAEGVENGLIESSQDSSSPVFRGTGSWASPEDIPTAVSEGVKQGLQESSSFRGTGQFVSADQIPWANKENAASPSIAVDTAEATASIEEIQSALDEIDSTEAEATATVDPSGAIEGAAEANAAIDGIVREVTTVITIDINTTRHGLGAGGNSGGDWVKETRPTGDSNFHGGEVLVNDEPGGYNPELIVANGRAFIANGGDPAVINLPRGAIIYNADETRDIFNGGADLLNIPSFAYATGTKSTPYKAKKPSSGGSGGSSGSSSGGSSSSMSDDDMLKKLNEYMEQILDMAEDALNDQLEAINAQIYALKYQTEAAEKASALEEARLELLEAEKNLLDANTERTVRYYNAATGQWEWMADQREVLRAQEELADAQKNLLEAEYDALTTAWKELKDEIEKALKGEGTGSINIDAVLAALGKSAAKGSKSSVESLISDIFGYSDDPRAYANFDGGGIAHGLGWMPKGTAGAEAVLDSNLTNAILNPVTNAAFTGFTNSLTSLFELAGGVNAPSGRYMGNVSNMYGGNTYIEGVRIGSDMMNRPLSEVLSTLNLYKNA